VPHDVRQPGFGLGGSGSLDHGGGEVDPRDLPGDPRRSTGDGARPAGYVEDLVVRSDRAHPEQELGRLLMAGELGEVDGLAAELLDHPPVVFV
jgi:hypothetical protein